MRIRFEQESKLFPRIKVIGVGGGGGNAVSRIFSSSSFEGVEFIAVNTDAQDLQHADVPHKIQIGEKLTKGRGTGGNPEVGREAASMDSDRISQLLYNTDILFLSAGLGGGTGTGAAPVIAQMAKGEDILTIAVVTLPFEMEGPKRMKVALDGLAELEQHVDTIIVVPNENLNKLNKSISYKQAYALVDDILKNAILAVSEIIMKPGLINRDAADVKALLKEKGRAMIGIGIGEGEQRAKEACKKAISCPLLENDSIRGARSLLVHIAGYEDVSIEEIMEIANTVKSEAWGEYDEKDENRIMLFGQSEDENLAGKVRVIVIATDFEEVEREEKEEISLPQQSSLFHTEKTPSKKLDRLGDLPPPFMRRNYLRDKK